jgi:hypothetical protein
MPSEREQSALEGRVRNEFFGDINDYRKYGLLRTLSGSKKDSVAVCWMLRPNEDRPTKVEYLCRDKTWRHRTSWHFDERLFDALHQAVCVDGERNVARAAHADILSPEVFGFYEGELEDGIKSRKEYFEGLLARFKGSDLLFFDPDNGLEVKSVRAGSKGSSKYLYIDELSRAFAELHSILVFQFFRQIAPQVVINRRTEGIFSRLQVDEIASFETPSVIFFLIPQPGQLSEMKERSDCVRNVWGKQIQPEWHLRTCDARTATCGPV